MLKDDGKSRVIIAGGGIAGLCFAIALRSAYKDGEVIVLEKVSQIEAAGSGYN
jgi:2-polyprenyl-6-methoxyphenol hydroxylase-like FAD-dependent oxidoreductase